MAEEGRGRMDEARRASLVGVALNCLLFAGKFWAGLASGAVSVTADAFNNLSDAANAAIGLLGFALAARPADEEHPYGHARYEYISALVISALILSTGFGLLWDSVGRIRAPRAMNAGGAAAAVLAASVAAKLLLAAYDRRMGARLSSAALRAAALDSACDALATSAVLAGLLIHRATGVYTDGWLGAAVALLVLRGAVSLLRETVSQLLGRVPTAEEVRALRMRMLSFEGVLGVHDILIHDYGPGHRFASAHAEVPADWSQMRSHALIDAMERQIGEETGLHLLIHCDPVELDDPRLPRLRASLEELLSGIDPRITLHDLRIVAGEPRPKAIFDCVAPYGLPLTERQLSARVEREFRKALGREYVCMATVEHSYTGGE